MFGHWRHDYQFWNTFYTEKTQIRVYLCDGDSCDNIKVRVKRHTEDGEKRIKLKEVDSMITEKATDMLKNKGQWKRIEKLQDKWRNWRKPTDELLQLNYCSDCGSSQITDYCGSSQITDYTWKKK